MGTSRLLVALAAGFSIARAQVPTPPPISAPPGPGDISFTVIEFGIDSALQRGGVFVLKSPAEWRTYLREIGGQGRRRPSIDWRTQQVVAVNLEGDRITEQGFSVKRLHQTGNGVDMEIVLNKPVPGFAPHMIHVPLNGGETNSYEILVTPRFNLPIKTRLVED